MGRLQQSQARLELHWVLQSFLHFVGQRLLRWLLVREQVQQFADG